MADGLPAPVTPAAGERDVRNAFLSRVAVALRSDRPLLPDEPGWTVRREVVDGAPFIRVWFRTSGCTHDRKGRCTFCDYGRGGPTSAAQMVGHVVEALETLRPVDPTATLLVSPSGSMFDRREVPREARRGILEALSAAGVGRLLVETRAETVDAEALGDLEELLPSTEVGVEVGLETADPWVARYAINKGLRFEDYRRAIAEIGAHRTSALSNVAVGAPFLGPAEAVEDAERAVRVAFAAGTDVCVLFPLHVRRWTVTEVLWRHGLYEPASLWALIEVLARLGPLATRVSISWHRDYALDEPGSADTALASPTTCPRCAPQVLGRLDELRATGDPRLLDELVAWPCACHARWREQSAPAGVTRRDRAALGYELLGRSVLGEQWWFEHGAAVLAELRGS